MGPQASWMSVRSDEGKMKGMERARGTKGVPATDRE